MDQKTVWESIAEPWKKNRKKPFDEVIDFLKDKHGTILDIGCGSGRNFIPGRNYVGIDFSKNMLKYTKKYSRKKKINAFFVRGDATALPVRNDYFDTVVYVAVLHTIKGKKSRKKSLLELRRAMKKGGH